MSDFWWGLVLLGTYVLLVILARWIYIARSNVVWSNAQAEAMTKRLSLRVKRDPSRNGKTTVTQETLEQLLVEIKKESPQRIHTQGDLPGANSGRVDRPWITGPLASFWAARKGIVRRRGPGRHPWPALSR